MKVTNAELAAVYRAEAAHTKHKKWAETLRNWAEKLAPSQADMFAPINSQRSNQQGT